MAPLKRLIGSFTFFYIELDSRRPPGGPPEPSGRPSRGPPGTPGYLPATPWPSQGLREHKNASIFNMSFSKDCRKTI